ncbi:LysR family transcriptional regulator [Lentzea sp. NBRC 105346]|uniref:LysR family transcriptional regulator n=1 Tax=Lentzea sp. NBRC 105346 TaxID=3032205 RepID=UPI0024A501D1|nr:LysR family transcriptional regulator [Lentzea sp. NBRC 105346]GLZ29042.1 LysR family transcriptional regulator [Lentzea sp. NBRC 105346]
MSDFTVAGLRVVREAARHGSFSAAADRLGYTQSAISRQIALMEQAAGRPLFDREARGVRPTEAGRIVLRHADAVLGELDAARQSLQDLTHPAPVLRVGAFSTAMAALVPRAIAAYPGDVKLREGLSPGLTKAVAGGRLDLAVVTGDGVPLLDDPLLVAMAPGHPLAGRRSVTPRMLRDERWIVGSTTPGTTLLGAWAPDATVAFVARDWFAKLGLVAAGLGVTVVPGLAVPVLPPGIAVARIDHPEAVRRTAVVVRAAGVSGEFVEALRDAAAEVSAAVRNRLG